MPLHKNGSLTTLVWNIYIIFIIVISPANSEKIRKYGFLDSIKHPSFIQALQCVAHR